jgi:hypothetical protein
MSVTVLLMYYIKDVVCINMLQTIKHFDVLLQMEKDSCTITSQNFYMD